MTTVEVHAVTDGPPAAAPVVLSNSLGSTLRMWDPQVPHLAQHFRVVRYDHRGHGQSPVPPGPYTIGDLGEDVIALLDRLEVARTSFCGLSLGGMVGLWLAANAPERIDRLVVCCTSARLGPPKGWRDRAATVREHGTSAVAEAVVARWFTPAFTERNPELVASMRTMISSTSAEGYAACCDAIAALDLEDALARVQASTLVVAGGNDLATPPEHAYRIAARIADARVVVVDDAAHLANVEQPDRVTRLVLDHLLPTTEEAP